MRGEVGTFSGVLRSPRPRTAEHDGAEDDSASAKQAFIGRDTCPAEPAHKLRKQTFTIGPAEDSVANCESVSAALRRSL